MDDPETIRLLGGTAALPQLRKDLHAACHGEAAARAHAWHRDLAPRLRCTVCGQQNAAVPLFGLAFAKVLHPCRPQPKAPGARTPTRGPDLTANLARTIGTKGGRVRSSTCSPTLASAKASRRSGSFRSVGFDLHKWQPGRTIVLIFMLPIAILHPE